MRGETKDRWNSRGETREGWKGRGETRIDGRAGMIRWRGETVN